MPSNDDFTLTILVGGTALPEYHKDGECFVESNLFTPYSYQQVCREVIGGENETQKWPVTPFVISVQANAFIPHCYFQIFVDGQIVKKITAPPGKTRIVHGFRDGNNCVEFLFSLPRFSRGEDDKISTEFVSRVGLIEVKCFDAVQKQSHVTHRKRKLQFDQANKKDSYGVTQGKFIMATTKAGRVLKQRSTRKLTTHWEVKRLRSQQKVKYVMSQTLTDLGINVIPIPFIQPPLQSAAAENVVLVDNKTVKSENSDATEPTQNSTLYEIVDNVIILD